jgi:hypothetical protein
MADKIEIEVILRPDGTVQLTTHGLKGQTCATETLSLEKAVGQVVKREKTSEFWQQATGGRAGVKVGGKLR